MNYKNFETAERPDLSIVIPAFNEERRIGRTLDMLAAFLATDDYFKNMTIEVIVVAADASDNTKEIVRTKQSLFKLSRLLSPGPKVGKGRDVQYGMLRAYGKVVIHMDADLATPLYHLRDFYIACSKGADLVIGNRNLLKYRGSFARNLFSRFGNLLYVAVGGVRVEDTQCGFKMFNRKAAQICFSKLTLMGWGFDLEVLAIAQLNGLHIQTLRIDDWEDKPFSTYHDNPAQIAMRSTRDFITVKLNTLRGRYVESESGK